MSMPPNSLPTAQLGKQLSLAGSLAFCNTLASQLSGTHKPMALASRKIRILWTQSGFLSFFDLEWVSGHELHVVGKKNLEVEEDIELYRHLDARLQRGAMPVQLTVYQDEDWEAITSAAQITRLSCHDRFFLAEMQLPTTAVSPWHWDGEAPKGFLRP